MLEIFLICLVFGCFSGILAGLFGIGGGLVLVPFFLVLLEAKGVATDLWMLMAVGTSLATMIVTSIAATLAHHFLGAVLWKTVRNLSYGIMVGVMLGAWVASLMSAESLRIIFAFYMLSVAVQMAVPHKISEGENPFMAGSFQAGAKTLSMQTLNLSGGAIGFIASLLGIGGGTLIVPYLSRFQMPMRHVIAVSSACGLPLSIVGTLSYTVIGWDKTGLPEGCIGYVYMPAFLGIVISSIFMAPLGARLANSLPTEQLKKYFSILLFVVAGKLFWAVFY